ncbi:nucleoside deaminase [Profundibacterium mesophilum]|uniref:Cytidine and deoxycytidylate deaminase n=1 Tax=Profundibacterium mesophilum KAUST100406-0324 TaxID=1037889 RepID=A0A921NS90_9RHOB|nr:nucleoside deaminase [Profundibacterium mesophilum]KAF0675544.1 Cytidine and deoxycytidylate deaminase [Profundibacterium mesophilum KAUST100406-0324]
MTPTPAERGALADAIRSARDAAGAGPRAGIAAAIVLEDRVVAVGVNEVHLHHDPTRHAEIVAIGAACRALGRSDLSGATLVSTLQPCEMCLAAMRFSGIDRLVFAADKPRVAARYFQFPSITIDAFREASGQGFDYAGGVDAEKVLDLYADGDE